MAHSGCAAKYEEGREPPGLLRASERTDEAAKGRFTKPGGKSTRRRLQSGGLPYQRLPGKIGRLGSLQIAIKGDF